MISISVILNIYICRLRDCCSGHRGCLKPGCYNECALGYHIFNNHPKVLSEGLDKFAFGVLKHELILDF